MKNHPKPPRIENQAELQRIFAGVVIDVLKKMTETERMVFFDRLKGRYCSRCGGGCPEIDCTVHYDSVDYD